MIPTRQSTALEIAVGPVLDADGVAVTGCVVGDFKIKKTTGNFAALNGSATLTHVSTGVYDLVLTTSDTDTVGICTIAIDDTTNACASLYLQVMEEEVYDDLYAASAVGYLKPTTAGRDLDVSAGGEAGIDWANVGSPTTSVNLSGTTVNLTNTVTTYTGNTPQTGDSYAIVNSGTHGNAALKTLIDAVDNIIDTEFADLVTEVGKIPKSDGTATWNATALASIQTEANDALVANKLDHLVAVADADDPVDNSIIAKLAAKGATADWSDFVNTTDSLQALRDRGDAAWITATGFSTHSAADVWASGTRTLTALDEDSTTLDLDATIRAAMGMSSANLDTQLSTIAGYIDTEVAATLAAVDTEIAAIQSTLAGLFTTALTESYRADGATGTVAQLLYEINQTLGERSISSTTATVKKVDGSTTAFSQTLNDATTPTAITRAA